MVRVVHSRRISYFLTKFNPRPPVPPYFASAGSDPGHADAERGLSGRFGSLLPEGLGPGVGLRMLAVSLAASAFAASRLNALRLTL